MIDRKDQSLGRFLELAHAALAELPRHQTPLGARPRRPRRGEWQKTPGALEWMAARRKAGGVRA